MPQFISYLVSIARVCRNARDTKPTRIKITKPPNAAILDAVNTSVNVPDGSLESKSLIWMAGR